MSSSQAKETNTETRSRSRAETWSGSRAGMATPQSAKEMKTAIDNMDKKIDKMEKKLSEGIE